MRSSTELKSPTYEVFIGLLSVLSLINIILVNLIPSPDLIGVIYIMDGILSIIFLSDFLYRLLSAESKSDYFIGQYGWADLLASLPFPNAKILRIFRLLRVLRLLRRYGVGNMLRFFLKNRAESALLTILFLVILVLEFGGLAMLAIESQAPNGNIKTPNDAIWYMVVTIATVGYGDRYPTTDIGRYLGMVIMTIGVGLFGTFTGFLANLFLKPSSER